MDLGPLSIDINALSKELAAYLQPFLPYLLKAGEKALEEAAKKFGAVAVEKAQALWGRLRGQEKIVEAAQDVAALPDDQDTQAALRLQIKKLLQSDESLRQELSGLWQETRQAVGGDFIQMHVNVSGHAQVGDIIGKKVEGKE